MDKTKIAAIGFLAVLGGALLFARNQEAPQAPAASTTEQAVAHDHDGDGVADHGDEAHNENAPSAAPTDSKALSGGVTKLKIEDQKKGDGATAQPGDTLTMNYRGTLLNGKEFDSSLQPGREPFQFTLGGGQVIKGWDEGIKGMKVGGKRKLTIPADLGYGDRGAGADIPPGATLVFEVELLDVKKGSGS